MTAQSFNIPPSTNDLPAISGYEKEIDAILSDDEPYILSDNHLKLDKLSAGFACALHMHQPTIPDMKMESNQNRSVVPDHCRWMVPEPSRSMVTERSRGTVPERSPRVISNLQNMFDNPNDGDNHNAAVFAWCYSRMGEIIPELVSQGCNPRIMLDYSGNLLWGLEQMKRNDILDNLKKITCDKKYHQHVEWLGTMWSHAVIPSTPIPDIKLHIQAWQNHFASIFGIDALKRVKGFSPPEMHLPNHPDTLYEYIKALKECHYKWLLVQEHSVENPDGSELTREQKYFPNRLVARNSKGESISIIALIKTQGSDTKLVAQMQPYFEAKSLSGLMLNSSMLNSRVITPLVTQIADGENGGVMMNEFPRDYPRIWNEIKTTGNGVAGLNGTEYLALLTEAGVSDNDYSVIQAINQHKVWQCCGENFSPESVEKAIAEIKNADKNFHMDGASWTNSMSWVKGYENVLEPMTKLSAMFHDKYDKLVADNPGVTKQPDYQRALMYNLILQTSCFRYWGQGIWTDYAAEIFRRGKELI